MAALNTWKFASRCNGMRLVGCSSIFPRGISPLAPLSVAVSKSSSTAAASTSQHNHSRHWAAERIVTGGLLALIPAAIAFPSPPLDYALALSMVAHAHWGLEAITVDYIRPQIFGPIIPRISIFALYFLSTLAFTSLCYFNYTDVGLGQAVQMIWKL